MKQLFIIMLMVGMSALLQAQQLTRVVIGNVGTTSQTTTSKSVSWTIGEMAVLSLRNQNHRLTQGFQQGERNRPDNCPEATTTFAERVTCDFTQVGIDTITYVNTIGCDSVVIETKTFGFPFRPLLNVTEDVTLCGGDSLLLSTASYTSGLQWTRNGAELVGATDTDFYVTESGIYGLTYTNEDGCSIVSDMIEVDVIELSISVFVNQDNLLHLVSMEGLETATFQWYFNEELIENATESMYCADRSGSYTLEARVGECIQTYSLGVEIDETIENCTVNSSNGFPSSSMSIYPNPTDDNIWLQLTTETSASVHIEITNLNGQVLKEWTQQLSSSTMNHQLTLDDFASGTYYVRIIQDNSSHSLKVVKL
ncbi:MAG: T9SS type A sorting domain-containing protein [Bacteroidota bacterium]